MKQIKHTLSKEEDVTLGIEIIQAKQKDYFS